MARAGLCRNAWLWNRGSALGVIEPNADLLHAEQFPLWVAACRYDVWYCCSHLLIMKKARKGEGDLFCFLVWEREEALRGAWTIMDGGKELFEKKNF